MIVRQGMILSGVGGLYRVDTGEELLLAGVRGILRKDGQIPTVGDRVDCTASGDPDRPWLIERLHERRNRLIRPAVANLDALLITVSAADPPPDCLLVDKLLTLCLLNQIEPMIILTKTDLTGKQDDLLASWRPSGVRLLETAPGDDNLDLLNSWIRGRTVSLAGQSGVGKSTLLNRLWGGTAMPVGSVSRRIGRGRHTTREVIFFPYAGGYLADTPGFSTLELEELGISGDLLPIGYPELQTAAPCRFDDCRHLGEPGCSVPDCAIHPDRLARYRQLRSRLDDAGASIRQRVRDGRIES
jgi:ribosome biogenesis GTPase